MLNILPRRQFIFNNRNNIIQQLLRSHNATSAEGEGIITTTQTTCTLANNASGKKNEQRLYIARHNVGAAQYVVEVVVLKKRNGIINNFCARTTPRAQRERGNYNDNTDNMYARQQCEREGERQLTVDRGRTTPRAQRIILSYSI